MSFFQVEGHQGSGDDTALNAINLSCYYDLDGDEFEAGLVKAKLHRLLKLFLMPYKWIHI